MRFRRPCITSLLSAFAMAALFTSYGSAGSALAQTMTASSGTTDTVQIAAQQALSAPSQWQGPVTGPKPLTGRRIAIVACAELTEGCNRPARAAVDAAHRLGWGATIFDGQGDVGKQLAAVNAAVDGKYDGILLILTDPVQLSEGIKRALKARIPVVTLGEPAYTPERLALLSAVPDVSHDWKKTGDLIADYMIWKSDGRIDALLLNDPDTAVVTFGQFVGTYTKLTNKQICPHCKVRVENFTVATLNTQPAELASAAVEADPKINWVWCFDFCMANVATDLIARGIQDDISGAGFDCNAQNLQLIRDGRVQKVCVADPRDWEAWAAVDTINRLMQGQPAVAQSIPVRLFDKSNIDDLSTTDLKEGWQGGIDFRTHYLKLWGVD